jgi:hypothetical protein
MTSFLNFPTKKHHLPRFKGYTLADATLSQPLAGWKSTWFINVVVTLGSNSVVVVVTRSRSRSRSNRRGVEAKKKKR